MNTFPDIQLTPLFCVVPNEIAKIFPQLDKDAIDKALESYDKIGTDVPTKNVEIIREANAGRQNLSVFFVNQAITALQGSNAPNYEQAYESFLNSLRVNPQDTLGLLYGGFVAEQLSMFSEALGFYDKLMKMDVLNKKNSILSAVLFWHRYLLIFCASWNGIINFSSIY